ncbi:MAG: DNA adenine methylase [Hormoscilla sp. SP5CHS1]|nr:DNA adenine methylase [Hormoscilla sp. SP12CHS1]MBC6455911.1 DNA adenine methylase [Hormoscilla sp. SP5CHS1]
MSSPALKQVPPRPFLKWAGGKNRLIPQYQPYFPKSFNTYYEPFLGGGAVFFHLQPQSAVLTDINPELINAYCCVRDNVEELIERLQEHQQKHSNDYYYERRKLTPDTEIERAARFIYLNRTCFNGLYRENSQGEFNVPIGRYKNPQICNPELLRSASATLRMRNVKIEKKSFEYVLDFANSSDDFVYFDPPYYPVSSTSNFTAYSRDFFSKNDQTKLGEIFVELAGRGVKVMLSNSDYDFIRDLYSQFKIHKISAARFINSNGKKRGNVSEILVASRDCC